MKWIVFESLQAFLDCYQATANVEVISNEVDFAVTTMRATESIAEPSENLVKDSLDQLHLQLTPINLLVTRHFAIQDDPEVRVSEHW